MGKKGRPRNALAERKPSGDAKTAPKIAEKTIPPALWGRLKAVNDPLLASEVGRLVYEGQLTRAQAEVAWRIGEVYQRWHRSQRLRPTPKSGNLEGGFPGGGDVADERLSLDEIDRLETETERIEANFIAVRDEVMACPSNLRSAVLDLCVYDTPTNPAMYENVRRFLARMAHFFVRGQPRKRKKADIAQQLGGFAQPKPPVAQLPPGVTHIRRGDPIHLSWKIAVEKVVRRVLPKLPDDEVSRILEITVALRDREEIRLRKERVS